MATGVFGGPEHPADIRVQDNRLRGNQPADLGLLDPGTNVRIAGNACQTSVPDGLCAAHR